MACPDTFTAFDLLREEAKRVQEKVREWYSEASADEMIAVSGSVGMCAMMTKYEIPFGTSEKEVLRILRAKREDTK